MTIRQSDITGTDTLIQPAIRDFADGLKSAYCPPRIAS